MESEFKFSLLENGLDFLLSSLEHLTAASAIPSSKVNEVVQAVEQKRHLKCALLHLCSSIELIFKERLRQEHWSLVFKDVSKASRAAISALTALGPESPRTISQRAEETTRPSISQIQGSRPKRRPILAQRWRY